MKICKAALTLVVLAHTLALHAHSQEKTFKIVTSFYPIYILTLNITQGIPGVSVKNLVRTSVGCLHDYQLSPSEMRAITDASVIIINGAGMESFLDKISSLRPAAPIIDSSKGVALLRNSNGEINGHIWLSIPNAEKQVDNIVSALVELDATRASAYRANAATFTAGLERAHQWSRQSLKQFEGREIITFHEAFEYLAQDVGIRIAGVVEKEPGSEISSADFAFLIRLIRSSGVKSIFTEPQYPARSAEAIAREAGIKTFELDPLVSGPLESSAYLQTMQRNVETLRKALQ